MKEEIKKRKEGQTVGGANHALTGEVVPSWEDTMEEEESHDGSMQGDWEFVQGSQIEENLAARKDKKDSCYDISGNQDHSCNQSESKRKSEERKF